VSLERGDRDLLEALAARFDPRIVQPDRLAERAFWAIASRLGVLEVDLQTIRRMAGWRSEDWASSPATTEGDHA